MENYLVVRGKGNVIVSIMFNRNNNKYHFVNQTHGHICSCAFDSYKDAIADMEQQKQDNKIIDYFKIGGK